MIEKTSSLKVFTQKYVKYVKNICTLPANQSVFLQSSITHSTRIIFLNNTGPSE